MFVQEDYPYTSLSVVCNHCRQLNIKPRQGLNVNSARAEPGVIGIDAFNNHEAVEFKLNSSVLQNSTTPWLRKIKHIYTPGSARRYSN
jgi:hypothetical protein